jgi:hypothetical protein
MKLGRLSIVSLGAGVAGAGALSLVEGGALGAIALALSFGALAGAAARRQGWLAGLLAGIPQGFWAVIHWIRLHERIPLAGVFHFEEFWRLGIPVAILAVGPAIMGGIIGAWLRGTSFKSR